MKNKNSKLFWYVGGMVTLAWIVPLINSMVNLIIYYIQIIINDIGRENQKSQSRVNAEYPIESNYIYAYEKLDEEDE